MKYQPNQSTNQTQALSNFYHDKDETYKNSDVYKMFQYLGYKYHIVTRHIKNDAELFYNVLTKVPINNISDDDNRNDFLSLLSFTRRATEHVIIEKTTIDWNLIYRVVEKIKHKHKQRVDMLQRIEKTLITLDIALITKELLKVIPSK